MIERERKMYELRIENFINRLKESYNVEEINLEIEYCKFDPHVDFNSRLSGKYKPIKPGDIWGQEWERAWFHIRGTVPGDWKGKNVIARINLGGESILFSEDGTPILGLSHHTLWGPEHEFFRDRVRITDVAEGGEEIDFWLESSASQLFGLKLNEDRGDVLPLTSGSHEASVSYAQLNIFREDIWDLYLDSRLLFDLMKSLPVNSVRRVRILRSLNRAIDIYMGDEESTAMAASHLSIELKKEAAASDLQTIAVGHAHLDTAWLWPLDETIRKCARTFSSQISLLSKYPDYIFGASQAQQYEFVKQYYPDLYKEIKRMVHQKKWELLGAMWVEPDCNIISGESMVRQLLYGKAFFRDEFGIDINNLWLPDVFGYSAALPQILKKSGVDYMITQKISWSQFNKFPYHSFKWRGIDGTEIIVHFPPEDNYNSEMMPSKLRYARENFNEKDFIDEFLTLYGIGDGGCGPTEEIIENGLRQQNLEGIPRVKFGTAEEFLNKLSSHEQELPIWAGELYLELHRGTLTTQAFIKKANRRMELSLREIEYLCAMGDFDSYPGEKLNQIWKRVLLNQFHDILPGSSITRVYDDCKIEYDALVNSLAELKQNAITKLFEEDSNSLILINTLSFEFHNSVTLPDSWRGYEIVNADGYIIDTQVEDEKCIALVRIPALSLLVLRRDGKKIEEVTVFSNDVYILENARIRYEFDGQGQIVEIYDKEARKQVLASDSKGNVLSLYEDRPTAWDAWDIDIYYEKQKISDAKLIDREWLCDGSVRKGFRQILKIGHSEIIQNIYLDSHSKRLDFETHVSWHEDHKMLRVAFDVDIYHDTASYEIQYGFVRRNTHRNTSWDMAKFEVPGHRFADLSDANYGVALLNDCKYGYKIYENSIDMNLLRSPTVPDPQADRGEHSFTYSLLPHSRDLVHSNVHSEASQLNQKPIIIDGFVPGNTSPTSRLRPVELSSDDVILEVMKKAENENSLIIRLYEYRGNSVDLNILLHTEYNKLYEADLLENNLYELPVENDRCELKFKPFEIKTLKITA